MVRTALQYCWPDPGPRVLLVTSTSPGEGKTLTAVNLALTLEKLSQRAEAIFHWEAYLRLVQQEGIEPEEQEWLNLARSHLARLKDVRES